jgi:tetratricopeptide (TPR) repeat protein
VSATRAAPDGFASVLALLQNLTLRSPIQLTDDNPLRHTVHRWTATALARRTAPDTLRQAHHRAARYWRWRVATVPQSRAQDIEELLEARYHHHQAEEIDAAVAVTADVCNQLNIWGAWRREEQLCRETLTWVPERSSQAAVFLHALGIIAQERGAYDEALEWYRRSLALAEELGNRAGMASSYGQIGVLFTTRGTPDAAVSWNLRSLLICMELRSPAVRTNLHWLTQQRQMLGETRFLGLLREQLSEDDVQVLLRQLDDFASNAQNDAGETATEVQGAHAEEPGDRASATGPETLSAPPPELPPEA